jgi:hypothetical protein
MANERDSSTLYENLGHVDHGIHSSKADPKGRDCTSDKYTSQDNDDNMGRSWKRTLATTNVQSLMA